MEDNLEEFGPVSEKDLEYFTLQARRALAIERVVIATFGGTSPGDIACVSVVKEFNG